MAHVGTALQRKFSTVVASHFVCWCWCCRRAAAHPPTMRTRRQLTAALRPWPSVTYFPPGTTHLSTAGRPILRDRGGSGWRVQEPALQLQNSPSSHSNTLSLLRQWQCGNNQ
jgi:hypothetical protein